MSTRKRKRKSHDNFESSDFSNNSGDPQTICTIFGACDGLDGCREHPVQVGAAHADPHFADVDADSHA